MDKPTVTIDLEDAPWGNYSGITISMNGKVIASGCFGGEPEDNCRTRTYKWVLKALHELSEALGAEVDITEVELED